jgi:hypothetical protein
MIVKPKVFQSTGAYKVRFFYLDITNGVLDYKILEKYVNSGGTVIPPAIPQTLAATTRSCALEFVSWNHSNSNLTNITQDLDVGAVYRNVTSDGIRKTSAFIITTAGTGLSVPVYFNKSDTSTLTISWGDGSANYTTTSSGNLNTSHTYSTAGKYEITIWISSGSGTYSFGNKSSSYSFVGGNNSNYIRCLENLFIGEKATLEDYALVNSVNLNIVNIPNTITSIGKYVFSSCRNIEYIITPFECTLLNNSCFADCVSLSHAIFGYGLTTLGQACLYDTYSLSEFIMPNSVNSVSSFLVSSSGVIKVQLSNNLTTIPVSTFNSCAKLKDVIFSNSITNIYDYAFANCVNFNILTVPSTVTNIGEYVFYGCNYLTVITLKRFNSPSDITTLAINNSSSINAQLRVYVPVGSLSVYQNATNWTAFANYMYEDTAQNRALFGD